MKKRLPSFLSGVLATALVFSLGLSALAVSGKLTLEVDPIDIQVNGAVFAPKDAKGNDVPVFAYNGTTYAPLRALAEAYGLTVGYDSAANMATVDAAEPAEPAAAVPAGDVERTGRVTVHTAEELLAAIAPDTEITLAPGEYNLTGLAYKTDNPHVVWVEEFDGPQLNVVGVKGLTLRGQDAAKTNVLITPRYADVFHFEGCEDILLHSLTVGHTPTGSCEGSVLNFTDTAGIRVTGCDLYGCGTYGIEADGAANLLVEDTAVRDCSYGAAMISDSQYVTFDGCDIHDNESYTLLGLYGSTNVAIVNSTIRNNTSKSEYYGLLAAKDSLYVAVRNCEFKDNSITAFSDVALGPPSLTVEDCRFEGNTFEPPV